MLRFRVRPKNGCGRGDNPVRILPAFGLASKLPHRARRYSAASGSETGQMASDVEIAKWMKQRDSGE